MEISGTIQKLGIELFLQSESKKYKIHIYEKYRWALNPYDHIGVKAIAEIGNVCPPQHPELDGWVRTGSLVLLDY